jgi:hypothetical protein
MKTFFKTSLSMLLLVVASEYSVAKEWRGITPLRSTRADVVRLLNQCSEQKEACAFTLNDEDVYILFSGGLTDEYAGCSKMLPAETVMFIDVEPKATPKIKSLNLDKKKFRTFNPAEPYKMDLKGYWNESDGLLINTLRGEVIEIDYLASAADKSRCLSFYEEPESFIRVIPVHVPLIIVDSSVESAIAGEKVTFAAFANVNAKRGYTWTVSTGKILSGQFTHKITVDTSGLAGQTVVATAEIRDVFSHTALASGTVEIVAN